MTDRPTLRIVWPLGLLVAACCVPDRRQGSEQRGISPQPVIEQQEAGGNYEHSEEYAKELQELLKTVEPRGPLDHPVSFSVLDTPLGEVAQLLSGLTGAGMTILSVERDSPPLADRRVSLIIANAPLGDALDWIMRQVDARYTWDGSGVCIASGDRPIFSDQLTSRVYPLRTMKRYDLPTNGFQDLESERNAVFRCVKELIAGYLDHQPDAKLILSPEGEEFVALCSQRAHRRIAQILREIARGRDQIAPLIPRPDTRETAEKLEKVTFCAFRDVSVLEVLGRLATEAGVNIGVDPKNLPQGTNTRITLVYGKASLRFTLDTIIKACGLKAYAVEDRGLWLHGENPYPAEGRPLWETGAIRSYYVEPSVERMSLGKLIELVKQNVTPDQWSTSPPALVYAPTGRLVVFHAPSAHAKLASYLYVLQRALTTGYAGGE